MFFLLSLFLLQPDYTSGTTSSGHPKALWDHVANQPGSAERVGPGADAETGAGTEAFRCV